MRSSTLVQAPPLPDGDAEAQIGDRTSLRSHSLQGGMAGMGVGVSSAAHTCLHPSRGLMGRGMSGGRRAEMHSPACKCVGNTIPVSAVPSKTGPRPNSLWVTSELTFLTFSTSSPRTPFSLSAELCPQLRVPAYLPTFIPFQ